MQRIRNYPVFYITLPSMLYDSCMEISVLFGALIFPHKVQNVFLWHTICNCSMENRANSLLYFDSMIYDLFNVLAYYKLYVTLTFQPQLNKDLKMTLQQINMYSSCNFVLYIVFISFVPVLHVVLTVNRHTAITRLCNGD